MAAELVVSDSQAQLTLPVIRFELAGRAGVLEVAERVVGEPAICVRIEAVLTEAQRFGVSGNSLVEVTGVQEGRGEPGVRARVQRIQHYRAAGGRDCRIEPPH